MKRKKTYLWFGMILPVIVVGMMSCTPNNPSSPKKQKVIIDTDMQNSFDDGIAFLLLAAHENIEILGMTTVTGNTWSQEGLAAGIRQGEIASETAMAYIGGSHLPLRPGRLDSLKQEIARNPGPEPFYGAIGHSYVADWREHYRADYGEAPAYTDTQIAAEDFIIRQVQRYPNEITLLAIGPCTNIAKALRKAPEIAGMVKQIVYMGGAIYCEGNILPYSEFNFAYDPDAAAICLRSPFPRQVMVSLDVCNTVQMDAAYYMGLYNHIRDERLKEVFRKQRYYRLFTNDPTAITLVWDVIGAAVIIDPTLITEEKAMYIDVDDDPLSPTYGKSYVSDEKNSQLIHLLMHVNQSALFSLLKENIGKY